MTKISSSSLRPRGSKTPSPASVLKVAGSNPGLETQSQEAEILKWPSLPNYSTYNDKTGIHGYVMLRSTRLGYQ